MSNSIHRRIHRFYNIALSAVIVITGARFIVACRGIYTAGKEAGGQIYSRAAVAEAFAPMALCTYLCLALVIGSFILHLALPVQKKKGSPEKNRHLILSRLRYKTDMTKCDPVLCLLVQRQQRKRRLHCMISAALLTVFSAAFLVYACIPSRWPAVSYVTETIKQTSLILFACLLIPTAYTIFTTYYCRRSLDQEISFMRIASRQAPQTPAPLPCRPKSPLLLIARYGILAAAIVLVIIGYCNGGIEDVIGKAAKICTECVGLG